MAYDNLDQEYHLTPRGWITGSSKYVGKVDSEVLRLDDAVETWNQHCDQASGWSREYKTVELIWHDPAKSEAERNAKFSKPS